ncbi:MAG: translation initiation factor IF-2 [Candidatus Omnitrophica bacterium]|nr:translation initiation factor IF-2 [Candidatus Omnitrophota bacterium]
MAVRVHELAKKLGKSSKDLIEELARLKISVKGHMSSLDDKTAHLVEAELVKPAPAKPAAPRAYGPKGPEAAVKAPTKPATVKPHPAPPAESKKAQPAPLKASAQPVSPPVPQAQVEPVPAQAPQKPSAPSQTIGLELPITVSSLASKMGMGVGEFIKHLMKLNIWLNMNQLVEADVLVRLGTALNVKFDVQQVSHEDLVEKVDDKAEDRCQRPPVVTLMGHVDHGKTSLLDAIRKTRVVEGEAGAITQHIGAYSVALKNGRVTFLDTPGHEAFTAMRARGANVTDVVVLVVAANDGLMPQTLEAIDHARAAEVTIVVALNKMDLPNIDLNRVKKQLAEVGLMVEEWGGKTIAVPVSAKTGKGIDQLLEMLLLEAELLELKANPKVPARGAVIEGRLSKGRGPVATVLVQNGTLRAGDVVLSGMHYGRVRAMHDDKGSRLKEAGPSDPVEIWGLSGVPEAGDDFQVVAEERQARELALSRQDKSRMRSLRPRARVSLEHLYESIQAGRIKELKIILKADVQGSVEAITHAFEKIPADKIKPVIIHSGVGGINESDVNLALASTAIVIGFHVVPTPEAEAIAEKEGIELRLYDIIYDCLNEIKSAMEGMLEPTEKRVSLGLCKVLRTFKVSKVGTISGCRVEKGLIVRNAQAHLIRDSVVVFDGSIRSLKRFKDDAKEVNEGMECGIVLADFNDVKEGDVIEAYKVEKVAGKL